MERTRIFAIFYRIEFSAWNCSKKGDFSPVDDGRDAFLFRGKLLSRKPMQLHFPWCYCPSERGLLLLFPLAKPVIAWKRAPRDAESQNACVEDCSRDLNGRIFLADFRTRYFQRTGSRAGSQSGKENKITRALSLSIYANSPASARIIAPPEKTGGVPPSSRHYREPLTATMLVPRPPLPSSRFYLGHNYSLFEAIWRRIHSKPRPIAPTLCSVSPFLAFYPRRRVSRVMGWPSIDQRHLQLGRCSLARARAYRCDAKVSLHLSHCGNFRGQSRMSVRNYLETRETRAPRLRIVNGKSIVDRKRVNEPALTGRLMVSLSIERRFSAHN